MAAARMRPRFGLEVDCELEVVKSALESGLERRAGELEGDFTKRHGVIRFPEDERRIFTPQLSLTLEQHDDAQPHTRVFGLFSPHPHVWLAFVFSHLALFCTGLFASMYGMAQLALGHSPMALLIPVVCAVLAAGVYGASFIGQGLALEQMYLLRSFLDECLALAEKQAGREPRSARDSAQL